MAGIDVNTASRDRLKSKRQSGAPTTVKGEGASTDATEREALGTVSGKSLPKGGGADMPKRVDYDSQDAWMSAVGSWRRKKQSGATMDNAGAALSKRLP